MEENKFKLIVMEDELYRIKALKDVSDKIHKGTIGGYVEDDNLSQEGKAWIFGNARVFNDAYVSEDAQVYDNAQVFNNAYIYGTAQVFNDARVCNNARVCQNAKIYENAIVSEYAFIYSDAQVLGDAHISGNAHIGMFGYIKHDDDYLHIGPIGIANATTFYKTKDQGIYVCCGRFNDSIEVFEKNVREPYEKDKYKELYIDTIQGIKKFLNN